MGHFYKLLCEEMIFLLHKGKNDGLRYRNIGTYPISHFKYPVCRFKILYGTSICYVNTRLLQCTMYSVHCTHTQTYMHLFIHQPLNLRSYRNVYVDLVSICYVNTRLLQCTVYSVHCTHTQTYMHLFIHYSLNLRSYRNDYLDLVSICYVNTRLIQCTVYTVQCTYRQTYMHLYIYYSLNLRSYRNIFVDLVVQCTLYIYTGLYALIHTLFTKFEEQYFYNFIIFYI